MVLSDTELVQSNLMCNEKRFWYYNFDDLPTLDSPPVCPGYGHGPAPVLAGRPQVDLDAAGDLAAGQLELHEA